LKNVEKNDTDGGLITSKVAISIAVVSFPFAFCEQTFCFATIYLFFTQLKSFAEKTKTGA